MSTFPSSQKENSSPRKLERKGVSMKVYTAALSIMLLRAAGGSMALTPAFQSVAFSHSRLGGRVSAGAKGVTAAAYNHRVPVDRLASCGRLSASVAAVSGEQPPPAERPFNPGPSIPIGSSGVKLNIFGAIYGFLAISLSSFWMAGTYISRGLHAIFGDRFDRNRRVPIALGNIWGWVVMHLTRCHPIIKGRENLEPIEKFNRGKKGADRIPVMFVANHCSFMDIPFVAMAIGWNNYKMIAKQELLKVPILATSLREAGHVILDRTNRRSQLATYKSGVDWLKRGVNLVTFAEGSRSKNGRLGPFKAGAFKMAEAVGAQIVPLSIHYAHKIQPEDYIFPIRPSRSVPGSITVGKPIETKGKSDAEVMEQVWEAIAKELPDSQKPEPGTPYSKK